MTSRLLPAVAAAVALGVCLPNVERLAATRPKPAPNIPVALTFRNATSPPDRLISVGGATYTNGEQGVEAWLSGSDGALWLNTCFSAKRAKSCTSQGRYHALDFSDPAGPVLPLPFSTPTIAPASIGVSAFAADGVTVLPRGLLDVMNAAGETRLGRMKANFPVDGAGYTLRFTPNMYPASSYLLITYLGGSTSCTTAQPDACASWSVETVDGAFTPYPDGSCCLTTSLHNAAELVTMDNSVDYGPFHLPFKLTISVLPR